MGRLQATMSGRGNFCDGSADGLMMNKESRGWASSPCLKTGKNDGRRVAWPSVLSVLEDGRMETASTEDAATRYARTRTRRGETYTRRLH